MSVAYVPVISVSWDVLTDSGTDLKNRADAAASFFQQASTHWDRFRNAYQHGPTQEQVYTALDELKIPMQDWAASVAKATGIVADFCVAGQPLQSRAEALAEERPGIYAGYLASLEADEPDRVADAAVSSFNERVEQLQKEWNSLVEATTASLQGVSGGTGDSLATHAVLGGRLLPNADWVAMTAGLNERFGDMSASALLDSLRGLSPEELRQWADTNPEAAAVLAGNRMMGPHAAGSAEAVMEAAMVGDAELTEQGVLGIRNAWLSLSELDQERLLLLFPAVFGSLNGVPMASRTRANIVALAGLRQINEEAIAELALPQLGELNGGDADDIVISQYAQEYAAYKAELERLEDIRKGLDHALKVDAQVVSVSLEGNGRILVMNGTPSAATQTAAVLVPGTTTTLGSLESYLGRLSAIDATAAPEHVSFYWQDGDLPQALIADNASSEHNENLGPRLAAFDYALDLEIPAGTRSTYIGYSAGGGAVGTAERVGLDSTNIVYVAPSGNGHEVGSPADTQNPGANRYLVQARDDILISTAQLLGGASQGDGGPSDPGRQMGAQRLESGFMNHAKGGDLVSGHSNYFGKDSTSALNIRGVITGTRVYPYVPEEIHTYPGGYWIENPLETRPGDYAGTKMQSTPTETCPAP